MEALFPDANPLALDLLAEMMQFDQTRRISVDAGTFTNHVMWSLCCAVWLQQCLDIAMIAYATSVSYPSRPQSIATAGYLSFHPMAQCAAHALKGLACRACPSRAH